VEENDLPDEAIEDVVEILVEAEKEHELV